MMHASSDFPELYLELETELGEKILNNTDAITLIIDALEKRFGVNKQADLMNTFNRFIGTTRGSNQDLVTYVATFDNAYSELKKLGESLSDTFLTLFMLSNANLPDTDFQIVTANIEFDKDQSNGTNNYEKMKNILRRHQYSKAANQKTSRALFTESIDTESIPKDMVEEFKVFIAAKNQGKEQLGETTSSKQFIKRCWKCRCKCPKFEPCNCECTKHPHWKCKKSKTSKRKDEEDDKEDGSSKKHKLTAYFLNLKKILV